jgi:hypothetical protein
LIEHATSDEIPELRTLAQDRCCNVAISVGHRGRGRLHTSEDVSE